MKNHVLRWAVAVGSVLFVASFFLPPDSTRKPLEMFQWTADSATSSETAGETAAWIAVALVMAYPYVWAALVVAVCAAWGLRPWVSTAWPHLALHTLGGLLLAALSLLFLALRDPWLPTPVQWTGATVPFVLLAIMWCAGLCLPRAHRAGAVMALGYLLQLPLQLVLRHICAVRGEPAWGFTLAAAGALLAMLGAAGLTAGSARTPREGDPMTQDQPSAGAKNLEGES